MVWMMLDYPEDVLATEQADAIRGHRRGRG
jgi:hypothetical protein